MHFLAIVNLEFRKRWHVGSFESELWTLRVGDLSVEKIFGFGTFWGGASSPPGTLGGYFWPIGNSLFVFFDGGGLARP